MNAQRLVLALLAVVLGALAIAASPASATETRVLEASFGPDGTAASAFEIPSAVGVDQSTGQIYVEDARAKTVQRFNSAHEPEPFTAMGLTGGVLTGFRLSGFPINQIAVNSTSHDFYVVNNNLEPPKFLQAFQSDGEPALFTAGPGAGTNEIGGFPELCGVAVDSNGDIYASDFYEGVQVFAPSGEHITTIAGTAGARFCNVAIARPGAVDPHGALYLNHFEGAVEKFTPSEFPVTPATTYTATAGGPVDETPAWGIAVDPATNHLLVDEHTTVAEYEEAGNRLLSFGALTAFQGLAVNGVSGQVYVDAEGEGERRVEVFGPVVVVPEVTTGEAAGIHPTSATLNGTVNPAGVEVTGCRFDYGTTASYGQSVPCVETVGSGTEPVSVHAVVAGLAAGTTYHFRLRAENANKIPGFGHDGTVATLPPPAITAAEATDITETSANLTAKVNPGGIQLTDCHFEYGTDTGYGTTVPCVPGASEIPADTTAHPVSAAITGLHKSQTYHWRIVATNEAGTTTSVDHTFIDAVGSPGEESCAALPEPQRQQQEQVRRERGSTRLPDCRAYEMVTPANKNGALIGEVFLNASLKVPLIAANGQRVIAPSIQCFAEAQSCVGYRVSEGAPFAFNRTTGGWVTTPLTPPAGSVETSTYWSVNADAGTALYTAPTSGGSSDAFYALNGTALGPRIGLVGDPARIGERLSFEVIAQESLVSTADLSHVVYGTKLPVWSFDPGNAGRASLYEYVGPSAAPLMVGVSGGYENGGNHHLISACGTELGGPGGSQKFYATLSADGRSVYFTALGGPAGCPPFSELYARIDGERANARSVLISGPTPGVCTSTECEENTGTAKEALRFRDAAYEGASSDGSHVFFTDTQQLSDGANESGASASGEGCERIGGPGGCNLYESECQECEGLTPAEEQKHRRLIDVSEGAKESGGPRVQGVMAMSADGSHVYFIAKGKLTGEEENQSHEKAQEDADNLYVYSAGHLAFITTLAPADEREWHPGALSANATPDGRFLVFTSHRALTADATCVEGEAEAPVCPAQVFEYDAQMQRLVRVSIGERGFNDNGNAGSGDASIASLGLPPEALSAPVRSDPTMSDDGRFVFFQSPVALAPGALNDAPAGERLAQNVYEYHEGHVSLITDGKDTTAPSKVVASPVELLGTDTTGSNVFFATFDPLVPEDTDTQRDIYDAHVCSADPAQACPAPIPAPHPCGGEECHGQAPTGPPGTAPASESFNGPGNLTPPSGQPPAGPKPKTAAQIRAEKLAKAIKACRKKHGKKRVACERQARKAYGAKKANRPSDKRRTN